MSDKNIEIIKAIQATGQCPEPTPSTPLTQKVTEGLESSPKPIINNTQPFLYYLTDKKDNE